MYEHSYVQAKPTPRVWGSTTPPRHRTGLPAKGGITNPLWAKSRRGGQLTL